MSALRPVIDRPAFLDLGFGRQTWDVMVRELKVVRPNGERGNKVYLYRDEVEAYLDRHTIEPERSVAA